MLWRVVGLVLVSWVAVGQAQHLVIGLDNKIDIDDAGKQVPRPPGKDAVVIVDIAQREAPRIVGTLPLMNSLLGPPTNLAVTPDDHVALVANSVAWIEEGGTWKPAPDNKLFVIDLQASPPKLVETVTVGQQPSGMAINKAGTLVLIANRADSSVTVATLTGTQVKVINTITFPAGDEPAAVAITPDAKHALVARYKAHKLAVLDIDGATVTYKGPASRERHKSREEIEFQVSDAEAFTHMLERLGYLPGFRYEKYRTKLAAADEPGFITIDETPMGTFLELEGPADWIDRTAARLGFSHADYLTSSYASLYREYRSTNRDAPADMIF